MQSLIVTYYQVLGVNESTPLSQIRLTRKRLLATIHPDRFELHDPQRSAAEERAKLINEAFEGIKKARALPRTTIPKAVKDVEEVVVKRPRKRLETVESRVVVRNGKVVMIKRRRPIKFARLKDIRDSAREIMISSLDVIERKLAEKKAKRELAQANFNVGQRVSRVIHIVEGKVVSE